MNIRKPLPSLKLSTHSENASSFEMTEDISMKRKIRNIESTYRYDTNKSCNVWALEANCGKHLAGRPWNPNQEPLLKIIDQRKNPTDSLSPTPILEIVCLREDLEITNIQLKDSAENFILFNRPGAKRRQQAAEAYIKYKLAEAGLIAGNLSEPFAFITLAQTIPVEV